MAVTMKMPNDNGQPTHPFFIPKSGNAPSIVVASEQVQNHGRRKQKSSDNLPSHSHATQTPLRTEVQALTNIAADADFDQNEDRRKRQRTGSSDGKPTAQGNTVENAWQNQLQAAAFGRPTSNRVSQSLVQEEEEVIHTDSNSSEGLAKGDGMASSTTEAIGPIVDGTTAKEMGQLASKRSRKGPIATPPKKMLRVRPDGKLGSPKASRLAQDARSKRSRKKTKSDAVSKIMIAVIRYRVDKKACKSTGYKIDDILSGLTIHPGPRPVHSPEPSKPAGPPKPTHPFFLVGSAVAPPVHDSKASNDVKRSGLPNSPRKQDSNIVSHKKARVTSKPPDITSGPALAFGFGLPMFGSDHARISRFPGATEPLWPPEGMVNIGRPIESSKASLGPLEVFHPPSARRKLKNVEVQIPEEDEVLKPCVDMVHTYRADETISHKLRCRDWREFRRPLRRILTGRDLQQAVRQNLTYKLPHPQPEEGIDHDEDELSGPQPLYDPAHSALEHVYECIATSLTAFDEFKCETQDWVHKYAPKSAEDVLQQRREAVILRDWLKGLTITSVGNFGDDGSRLRDSSVPTRRRGGNVKRGRRKRAEDLEDFLVSSDEDASQMDDIVDFNTVEPTNSPTTKSVLLAGDSVGKSGSREKSTNAIVISGPHGCGKTTSVYAVAHELGFEVFEINSGSRRSGRDVLDKVGDMTRNHLVKHADGDATPEAKDEAEGMDIVNEKLKQDLESGRQGTVNSFFKPKPTTKKRAAEPKKIQQKSSPTKSKEQPKKPQSQKQSLILLEEVDVLFEEDKMFWTTTLELILQSKRPIIMTCTDESLVPLDDMALYAILRFTPPSASLATDYLLLVAANEGHLLSRDAVLTLYNAKGSDLRASLTELNFFCQMGIGDTKGGLEWMLPPSTSKSSQGENVKLRVVSDGTYQNGIGWFNGDYRTPQPGDSIEQETEMLLEAWNGWGFDIGASEEYISAQVSALPKEASRRQVLEALQSHDQAFETLSAADTFPACVTRHPDMNILETTYPELADKTYSSFVVGSTILQADPYIDETGVAASIALTLRTCANRFMSYPDPLHQNSVVTDHSIFRLISQNVHERLASRPFTKTTVSAAFEPIARSSKSTLGVPKGPQITSFDSPISIIATDLAPYVRSIVSYDLRLEEQRRQLSSLLSQPGKDGRKTRTTRASRAALEGGSKAHTRRERWFPNNTKFDLILQSGGKGWQDVLLQRAVAEACEDGGQEEESQRLLAASAEESDA